MVLCGSGFVWYSVIQVLCGIVWFRFCVILCGSGFVWYSVVQGLCGTE